MMRPIRSTIAVPLSALLLLIGASSVASAASSRSIVTITRVSPNGESAQQEFEVAPSNIPTPKGWPKRDIPRETPAQLKERAELSKKFRDAREAQGAARAATPPATPAECRVDGAEVAQGLVIDHFLWCQYSSYQITLTVCTNDKCTVTGRVGFRLALRGSALSIARNVSFGGYVDNFRLSGITSELLALPMTFAMKCEIQQGSDCFDDGPNTETKTIAQWIASPAMAFGNSSPETNAVGNDKLSWYDFYGTANVTGGNTVTTGANGFRCDSAPYLTGQGCVFDQTSELWYDLSVADPEVNETAQHIIDAQEQPDVTFPMWAGKTVPGSASSGQPLNRIYWDTRLRDNNHAAAVRTCRQYFGDDYATRGLDCDEYPFQSTLQGAAAGDNRYSARALTSGDNQAAGRLLGQFYDRQRIVDGDPFYVIVIQ